MALHTTVGLIPWIQLYTEDNKKGTKGHYGGISFDKEGEVAVWLGFGQTALKKGEIIDKRNQYLGEYAKIEMNLRHGFKYQATYVDAVFIAKVYSIEKIEQDEFYKDVSYLMNLYKKHEIKKKFGTIQEEIKNEQNSEMQENIEGLEESKKVQLEKGNNKLYMGYTQNGKILKMRQDYLYEKNEEGKLVMKHGAFYEIVKFHSKYKREEFVYGYDPSGEQYIAGAFYRIMKKAIKYTQYNFYLIIEDFNQKNLLEIFGDIINLLEREEDGTSKYGIHDPIMQTYIYGTSNKVNAIYMPSNLSIIAIENPKGEKIEQDIRNKFEIEWVNSTNEELDSYYIKGFKNIKWGKLRKMINYQIEEKSSLINTAEEKIDSYFLPKELLTSKENTENMIKEREKVTNILFIYLYENICQYNSSILFSEKINSIEDLIQKVKSKNYIEIFNDKIKEKL